MTEPPEPRRPEDEGGGELEPDADAPVDSDEWFDQLDDDVLLDQLGGGEDPAETGALGDMLGAWRDDVNEVPVPPIADRAQTIHDFNQEVDRATRPPDPGGTSRMAISDDAALLANIGSNGGHAQGLISSAEEGIRSAAAALQEAVNILNQHAGEAGTAAGGEEGEQLNGLGQQAASSVDQLLSAVAMFDPNEAQGLISQFYDAVGQAGQKHGS